MCWTVSQKDFACSLPPAGPITSGAKASIPYPHPIVCESVPPEAAQDRLFIRCGRRILQQLLHIRRERSGETQPLFGERVRQGQPKGVQRGPTDPVRLFNAVQPVAHERMTDGGKVYAKLVRASGIRHEPEQRNAAPAFKRIIPGFGGRAAGRDRALVTRPFRKADG